MIDTLIIRKVTESETSESWIAHTEGDRAKISKALYALSLKNSELKAIILDVAHKIACEAGDVRSSDAIGDLFLGVVDQIETNYEQNTTPFDVPK